MDESQGEISVELGLGADMGNAAGIAKNLYGRLGPGQSDGALGHWQGGPEPQIAAAGKNQRQARDGHEKDDECAPN